MVNLFGLVECGKTFHVLSVGVFMDCSREFFQVSFVKVSVVEAEHEGVPFAQDGNETCSGVAVCVVATV